MFKINGGFFWAQDDPVMDIDIPTEIKGEISNCVVYQRPKWYQIRQWYRALKLWLNLPYANECDSPAINIDTTELSPPELENKELICLKCIHLLTRTYLKKDGRKCIDHYCMIYKEPIFVGNDDIIECNRFETEMMKVMGSEKII